MEIIRGLVSKFRELFEGDLAAYPEGKISHWNRRFHYLLRKTQCSGNRLSKAWHHFGFRIVSMQHRMEISYKARIGRGLCLSDPFTVTINSNAVLGERVTLGKNVTIGKQNRGERVGSPVIGDRVVIGDNAVIVGNIRIGSSVRIAPGAYINRDIPDNSYAAGNPGTVQEQAQIEEG